MTACCLMIELNRVVIVNAASDLLTANQSAELCPRVTSETPAA